ncbi:MAG: hypothetical protein A3H98_02025 [Bacteroidetes bacterium RIFCSPLOWO2_02_FULL_36_8]|nr:MAG: hypothetical protein A3H98_02025 [Bacteroidetes bacterium RIFCSPLOWO2_02_FULL_36_8]OFY69480.1 MAG: hypothetical protein A3G23_10600 [Bacteroidetes bacterium RIFCSPLOWO2_12_FULL_37_12]
MKILNHPLIYPLLIATFFFNTIQTSAREDKDKPKRQTQNSNTRIILSGCANPTGEEYLDINNVRAMVLTGGDMWWDGLQNPHYEIPKGSGKMSLFTGALWLGGVDDGNNLKIAAQTYRQNGYDFFPGPLTDASLVDSAVISFNECLFWDKHFKINKSLIDDFRIAYQNGSVTNGTYPVPDSIKNWPAYGNQSIGQAKYLAPFFDYDTNGNYEPENGDYPLITGDQSIWWVINDKGNAHTETGGVPIGVEIQCEAFAFATTNVLNDATFYKYKIINRSSNTLNKTYLGQWTDSDLGYYLDDYVGCDVSRGLGYSYNGDDNDESVPGTPGYGSNPPAIGIDFLKGPKADVNDGYDNDRDGVTDEPDELIMMSNFFYYSNNASPYYGFPNGANQYYSYLRTVWGNGYPCTHDLKNGTSPVSPSTPATNFMFPGYSDPSGKWTGSIVPWDEAIAGNPPGDRRFLQSAGPFTLTPGGIVEVIVGVVWASGLPCNAMQNLKTNDDIIQTFFDSEFQMLPDFTFQVSADNLNKVFFNDNSKGTIKSWKWDFGDNTFAYTKDPVHQYPAVENFLVTMYVTDSISGKTYSVQKSICLNGPLSSCIPDLTQEISATLDFSIPSYNWLDGVSVKENAWYDTSLINYMILGGIWAPFKQASYYSPFDNPGFDKVASDSSRWDDLKSVDLILTNDKNKWTRSVVVNTLAMGGTASRLNKRKSISISKAGQPDTTGTFGMSWFPGYAVDADSGYRLNIIFGEDTMKGPLGNDLLWNLDTSDQHHYVYIMKTRYDSCSEYHNLLNVTSSGQLRINKRKIFSEAMWVTVPLLRKGQQFLSSEAVVKIRMNNNGFFPSQIKTTTIGDKYSVTIDLIFPSQLKDTSCNFLFLDSARINKILGLPEGFVFGCNTPNCMYKGGEHGCLTISSSKVFSDNKINPLNFQLTNFISCDSANKIVKADTSMYDTLIIYGTAGIKKNIEKNKPISIYPNPVSGNITILFPSHENEMLEVGVYTLVGQKIFSRQLKGTSGINSTSYNTLALPQGIYLIKIEGKSGVMTAKMMKF